MKSRLLLILLSMTVLAVLPATTMAQTDSTATHPDSLVAPPVVPPPTTPPPTPPPSTSTTAATVAPTNQQPKGPNERIYYGGTVSLSFGSPTSIGIYPMIGYKLTPKISGGAEVGYEWVDYGNKSTHNYGAALFGRYFLRPNLYAHAEYQAVNYEVFTGPNSSEREWVPFLLLGGGAVKPIGNRMSVYAEVLFDVLQDEKSPYSDWEPIINFGVAVGL
jgi:hypothetical protein